VSKSRRKVEKTPMSRRPGTWKLSIQEPRIRTTKKMSTARSTTKKRGKKNILKRSGWSVREKELNGRSSRE